MQLPAGVPQVACPQCLHVFSVPAASLPVAEVVGYENPLAPPLDYDPPPRAPMSIGNWLQVLFVLVLFAGGLGYGYWEFFVRPKPVPEPSGVEDIALMTDPQGGPNVRSDQYNFRFTFPPAPWQADDELRKRVSGGAFAMRPLNREAGLLIWVKDFQTHTPRDSVVREEGIARLEKLFTGLSYVSLADTELAGHSAMHLGFQGERASANVGGDCYLFAHQGIAYGLVTWGMEGETPWQGFALLNKRERWAEERAKAQVLTGSRLGYTLRDPFAVWKVAKDQQGYAHVDLALMAPDPLAPRYVVNAARVVVMLPPQQATLAAAAAQARQHLEAVQSKDYPGTRIEALPGQEMLPLGSLQGLVTKWHVIQGDSLQHFVVLAVFHRADATVVIQGQCPWRRRSLWERDFDELVRSFRME